MAAEPARPDVEDSRIPIALSVLRPRGVPRRAPWVLALCAAALFSIGAGAIHAATIRDQFAESTLYGLTFIAFAVGQIGWGFLALRWPSRVLAAIGLAGNAAVMAIWALTRTVGGLVGPAAGTKLPVGFADAVATTLEGLAVVGAVVAVAASRRRGEVSRRTAAGVWITAAAIAVPLATLAILSQLGALSSLPPAY